MRDSPAAEPAKRFNVGDGVRPQIDQRFRRLPRLVARAFAVVWRAPPRQLLLAGCLQVITGVGLAVQVLVAQRARPHARRRGAAPRPLPAVGRKWRSARFLTNSAEVDGPP